MPTPEEFRRKHGRPPYPWEISGGKPEPYTGPGFSGPGGEGGGAPGGGPGFPGSGPGAHPPPAPGQPSYEQMLAEASRRGQEAQQKAQEAQRQASQGSAAAKQKYIPEPFITKNIKPDQPGGQTATVNGKQYYVPGSTEYESGFRTPEEKAQASQRGLTEGPHSGKLVSRDTVLARVSVYSAEKGKQSEEWVRIDPGKEPELARMAAAGFTTEAWYKLNRDITKEYDAGRISEAEGIGKLNKAIQARVEAGGAETYFIPAADKLLTLKQANKLDKLTGEDQLEYP